MRLAVTGRAGQVTTALQEYAPVAGIDVVAVGRPELDLAEAHSVWTALSAARPDVIVSAAAYTAVDKAERDAAAAQAINADGARLVAEAAARLGVPVIHLSTDYVYDGTKPTPYVESDPVGPTSVYGRSKLMGEAAIAETGADHVILRTAWVYSPFGNNFLKTMLRLAGDRDEVRVVSDQHGNPTSALDIAAGIVAVARNLVDQPQNAELRGVFHMAGSGEGSWADFATAIFATSLARGGPSARVVRIGTQDYPTPARRPANSRLSSAKLAERHGVVMPDWVSSTDRVVARLVGQS